MMNYDDIRPYDDNEVPQYINELVKDEVFKKVLLFIYEDEQKVRQVLDMVSKIRTTHELQMKFMRPIINSWIIERITSGVTWSGLENLDNTQSYLFISNHRDIILDAAILNVIIANAGMNTTEIAIGNNLLIYKWIDFVVKLNRCFVVQRGLPAKEMLMASRKLSSYIRESITQKGNSVWIAQREGRTKDGNDHTQHSLLKMINLSNKKSLIEGFRELKIVPLSISYEREPCGISKVEEIYKKEFEAYVKTPEDDLKSMALGLMRPKGRVHFAFGDPIDKQLDDIITTDNINEVMPKLASYVDECIYKNYTLRPFNYLAADLINGTRQYDNLIDDNSRIKFDELLGDLVKTIGEGDAECQKQLFCRMYANPVFNKIR